ncbi:hypothetical protein [Thermococcus sp.]|uniref:hypothetical protein n=1 Tax=Thermococcus sp. TaxID=35749 RepID=UPI002635A60D|nr:hypothetical protein [Thermococcus sp.]
MNFIKNFLITRDVIVRYGIRNVRELREVAFYLFSNFTGRFTCGKGYGALPPEKWNADNMGLLGQN